MLPPRQSMIIHDHLQPPIRPAIILPPRTPTTHEQAYLCSRHPRPAIILPPPPMTSHNFTTITHNHPQPTLIKSPLHTNNDSLATTLLAVANSELYFCHHYSPRRIPIANLFATTHWTPTHFLFQKVQQSLLVIYLLLMPIKTKNKKQCNLAWVNFCAD